ncbi:MAG: lipoate--protein ligase family protein [Cyanobacteria bacterium CRU_2_1]|nr:lipoate--protein ligase family protein [Cyanobacteria bacterium RU_5_0]NJR60156.1 lipoate--protein ligase family protein [Cyanobacteria bacterium CRU_2_1]
MAIDLWLLEQHRQGLHPSTLRFYTWYPAAISLGYHQRRYPEFWQRLTWEGQPIELVRRPSGGRAVLHQGDLTYAVITSDIPGNRMQVYQTICEFLIRGWRSLGIELHYGQAGRGYIHNPNCFGTATGADLVSAIGTKLIGSAQLRRDGAILQHGSMQLESDPELFHRVFGSEIEPFDRPIHLSGENVIQGVVEALISSASAWFGVQLLTQPLSHEEWQQIYSLVKV